jgi:phage gp46-like protein
MSKQWAIDPTRRDYEMTGGAPRETASLTVPAYYRLSAKRRTWMYAPDETWGSDFHLEKKRATNQDASRQETIAARALQPMIDDGRASEIEVNAAEKTRHGLSLAIRITDGQGEPEQINFVPLR